MDGLCQSHGPFSDRSVCGAHPRVTHSARPPAESTSEPRSKGAIKGSPLRKCLAGCRNRNKGLRSGISLVRGGHKWLEWPEGIQYSAEVLGPELLSLWQGAAVRGSLRPQREAIHGAP